MWADHPCHQAAIRVDAMAPRMNRVVSAARDWESPSFTRPAAESSSTKRPRFASAFSPHHRQPPVPIASWCKLDPKAKRLCPSMTPTAAVTIPWSAQARFRPSPARGHQDHRFRRHQRQRPGGLQLFSSTEDPKSRADGVHTNMCVLGRSFGIRQMVRLGFNVVLARDLTDAMYDPRDRPYVSHTRAPNSSSNTSNGTGVRRSSVPI
ncbi:MAG: hypothetical protein CM1200mP2_37720 [Planctomycetaceae bacterium]|nr:MAG: hypothetical protein CM1200mP2_37720 [Planctomycetaceae bacterium]